MEEPQKEIIETTSTPKSKPGLADFSGSTPSQTSVLAGTGNVEKIRDILFGTQMREYEKRFVRLEDRMQKEVNGLKDELFKNFESLEKYMKKEFELLNERLEKEQDDRGSALRKLNEELKETSSNIERKILQTEDKLNRRSRELHEQILEQSKSLSDEIRQKHDAISELLDKEAQELRTDKVERADLSELMMEMAMRLSNKVEVNFNLSANDLMNE
ncbi:MAG: hypothetical protein PHS86_02800 [Syntrophaceae bacterium]|nr:hypothetical protein [Syntrophaceae bacterium]